MGVIGSFMYPDRPVSLASVLPSWTCYLDGNAFLSTNISQLLNLNNVEICSLSGFIRDNISSINLTVLAAGTVENPFLFDHLEYKPDATVITDNATVLVDAFDGDIEYSSGWTPSGDFGWETSVQGSTLNFDFVGVFRL